MDRQAKLMSEAKIAYKSLNQVVNQIEWLPYYNEIYSALKDELDQAESIDAEWTFDIIDRLGDYADWCKDAIRDYDWANQRVLLEQLFIAETEGEFRVAAAMYTEMLDVPVHALVQADEALRTVRRLAQDYDREDLADISDTLVKGTLGLSRDLRQIRRDVAWLASDLTQLSVRCADYVEE